MNDYFYDILDASNEPVRWWPCEHTFAREAIAGLNDIQLSEGEQVRVVRNETGRPFAVKPYGGVAELVS